MDRFHDEVIGIDDKGVFHAVRQGFGDFLHTGQNKFASLDGVCARQKINRAHCRDVAVFAGADAVILAAKLDAGQILQP